MNDLPEYSPGQDSRYLHKSYVAIAVPTSSERYLGPEAGNHPGPVLWISSEIAVNLHHWLPLQPGSNLYAVIDFECLLRAEFWIQ